MSDESEKSEKSESAFLMESLNATLLSLSQLIQQNKPGNSNQDGLISAMTITLEGKKNFNLWSKMIEMKLSGKDKFGYLDGSRPKPGEKDEACRKWKMEDSLVKDYMINSMHSSLIADIEKYNKLVREDRVVTFLDGLEDRLDNVRATILQLRPFPTLEQVFALVNREENRQGVMLNKEIGVENSMVMFAKGPALTMNKPNFNSKFKTGSVEGCTHCGFTNHTRDRCFKIIGYPEGWKDRKKKRQQRGEAHMVTSHPKEVALNGSDASRPTSSTAADPSTAQAATIISMNKHSILPPVENKEGSFNEGSYWSWY